jgi:hypothetical protein
MFADIFKQDSTLLNSLRTNFWNPANADDTLLFGDHTASLNKFLKEIEIESSYYNMNLREPDYQ